jgi:hypothetical protein
MNPEQLDDLANTSRGLIVALSEAQELVARRDFGPELIEILQHARDLVDILKDDLGAEGANVGITGELLATIEGRLDALAGEVDHETHFKDSPPAGGS